VLGGFNKRAIVNFTGNVHVFDGSFSYDGIDFYSDGFGPFTIENMRSEGPGRFFYRAEPNVVIRNSTIAESQGSRQITGTVTCTPDNARGVTIDFDKDPVGGVYPIDFAASALVGADVNKQVLVDLGSGVWFAGKLNSITSTTAGTLQLVAQAGTLVDATGVTMAIYDTNTCDMTWPSGQITLNDVGAAVMSPSGGVTTANSGNAKIFIDSVSSATSGKGYFTVETQGGPVPIAGSSDSNPVLFDDTVIEASDGGQYQMTIDDLHSNGLIKFRNTNAGDSGQLVVTNSQVLIAPISRARYPIFHTQPGSEFRIDTTAADIPAPSSSTLHTTGTIFTGSFTDTTNSYSQSNYMLQAYGNLGSVYGGPQWPLSDYFGRVIVGQFEPFLYFPRPSQGNAATSNNNANYFDEIGGATPAVQLSRITQLSENGWVDGKNLRVTCKFDTSDTCTFTFERSEDVTYSGVGTDYNAALREIKLAVGSDHFSTADLGKLIRYQVTRSDYGTRTAYGYVSGIVDATHIKVRQSPGPISVAGASSSTAFGPITATVGKNEPDANYMVWPSCDQNETFSWSSIASTGFTLTSSNGSSTARCNILIIR